MFFYFMKLGGQHCQPPVPEPYVQVTLHTALPATKYKFLGFLYFTFPLGPEESQPPQGIYF